MRKTRQQERHDPGANARHGNAPNSAFSGNQELSLRVRRITRPAKAVRRNDGEQQSAKEGVRSSEPDEWHSPNRRKAPCARAFPSVTHCVASNNHERSLRLKQEDERRSKASKGKFEPEDDKSASHSKPQGRSKTSSLRRSFVPRVACVAPARTRKSAEGWMSSQRKVDPIS